MKNLLILYFKKTLNNLVCKLNRVKCAFNTELKIGKSSTAEFDTKFSIIDDLKSYSKFIQRVNMISLMDR